MVCASNFGVIFELYRSEILRTYRQRITKSIRSRKCQQTLSDELLHRISQQPSRSATSVDASLVKHSRLAVSQPSNQPVTMRYDGDWSQVFILVQHGLSRGLSYLKSRKHKPAPFQARGDKATNPSRRPNHGTDSVYVCYMLNYPPTAH